MSILVSGIRIRLEDEQAVMIEKALRKLRVGASDVKDTKLVRWSVDARRGKPDFVGSVSVELEDGADEELIALRASDPSVTIRREKELTVQMGAEKLLRPVAVVGFGPAGMFASLLLAEHGYPVVVLERGGRLEDRERLVRDFWKTGKLDPESNVQFGEGGAGTFSDGKLTTRINDPRCDYVLKRFVEFGAPEEILVRAKPHLGTDRLRGVVTGLRNRVLALGGEIRTGSLFCGFQRTAGGTLEVRTADGAGLEASALILAPGHSARDTFEALFEQGLPFEPKPFSVGVRIEHLQSEVDRALYHRYAGHPNLPRGEYQLSFRRGGRGVYTFCMCPGGVVVPASSERGGVVVNGMSAFARDGINANAALVVSVGPDDYGRSPLDGIRYQRDLERRAFEMGGAGFSAPVMTAGRYLDEREGYDLGRVSPTYALGIRPGNFDRLFSPAVNRMLREGLTQFGMRQTGFDARDSVLTGVETRTSSPVRIIRNEDLQVPGFPGVYPCGEGAGYAGGIMSAAVDGIRVAQAVMSRFAPEP